jgi:hypothetical protein
VDSRGRYIFDKEMTDIVNKNTLYRFSAYKAKSSFMAVKKADFPYGHAGFHLFYRIEL